MCIIIGSDEKNDDRIRRKAYHVDNPVQAERSSGWKDIPHYPSTPSGVELLRSSYERGGSPAPSCAPLARGYSRSRPAVLPLKMKQKKKDNRFYFYIQMHSFNLRREAQFLVFIFYLLVL